MILEVDFEYPEELHDLHNDYPCAPEKIKVTKNMLSPYCQKIADKFNISSGLVSKLIPTKRKNMFCIIIIILISPFCAMVRIRPLQSPQWKRSCATFWISLQVRCMDLSSFSADLCQVILGLPCCLFPLVARTNFL